MLKEYISDQPGKNRIPFTVSGCIDPYKILNKPVRYMGEKYASAFIEKLGTAISESKWKLWENEKIVIAGMTKRIEAVFVSKPLGLGVGTYAIHDFGQFDKFALLGILNSSFTSYYLATKFRGKHLAGGYLAINKEVLEQLPVSSVGLSDPRYLEIAKLAQELTENSENDEASSLTLQQIDELVFQLFSVTLEEQAVIKNSSEIGHPA
jgi:hypothetical protein